MIYKIVSLVSLLFVSVAADYTHPTDPKLTAANTKSAFEAKAESLYNQLDANSFEMPKLESFEAALEGFYRMKAQGNIKKDVLTIVDFSLSSNLKRLWVIDLSANTVLFQTLVAHGRNSGEEFANRFSNVADSFKSSLGLYLTGEVYNGKHGMSLKLDGMEKGVNSNARSRSVVMHGADYVSESFIRQHNRLGRSQGCPAIPVEMTPEIINAIKGGSCLYIYHPSRNKHKSFGLLS